MNNHPYGFKYLNEQLMYSIIQNCITILIRIVKKPMRDKMRKNFM